MSGATVRAELFCEGADELDGDWVGAVVLAVLGVGEYASLPVRFVAFSGALRRTTTETVSLVEEGRGFVFGGLSEWSFFRCRGRTVRDEVEKLRDGLLFRCHVCDSPKFGDEICERAVGSRNSENPYYASGGGEGRKMATIFCWVGRGRQAARICRSWCVRAAAFQWTDLGLRT